MSGRAIWSFHSSRKRTNDLRLVTNSAETPLIDEQHGCPVRWRSSMSVRSDIDAGATATPTRTSCHGPFLDPAEGLRCASHKIPVGSRAALTDTR